MNYDKIENLGNGAYRIGDALDVNMYLVVGGERALLIDTGYGLGRDLPGEIRRITEKPLVVANTHMHIDHSGGNRRFEQVLVPREDLHTILNHEMRAHYRRVLRYLWQKNEWPLALRMQAQYWFGYPAGPVQYRVLPERIDLGGRVIKTFLLGGHTSGSTAFLDPADGAVYTGDALARQVWMFTEADARTADFADALARLSQLTGYTELRPAHQKKPMPFAYTAFYAAFVRETGLRNAKPWPNELFSEMELLIRDEPSTPFGHVSLCFCKENLS